FGFLLFHEGSAFAEAFAQVSQFGAANGAFALHFNLVHARRMQGKNTLHTFAVTDAANGEGFVQTAAAFADHHAGENLDALFVALTVLGVTPAGLPPPDFLFFFENLSPRIFFV